MAASEAELQLALHHRILEELGAKHREFETLTTLLDEIVFRCDNDGVLTLLNNAWSQKTGWAINESLGTRLRDYVDGGEAVHELSSQFSEGELLSLDVVLPNRDGLKMTYNLKARRGATSWYGSLHDISDLRNTVKALQDSQAEERKLSLVASGTDNLVIITDATGKIEWVNQAFIETTGMNLDEVKGRTPGSALQGPDSNPDSIEVMRNGIVKGIGFNVELINYNRTGQAYWVSIDCTPIFDNYKNIVNFIAIERIITEKKHAEETLRESEQHYRAILDTVTEPIFYCDSNFLLQYTNPAWEKMTGQSLDTVHDVYLSEFIHPDDIEKLSIAKEEAYNKDNRIKQELRFRDLNSNWRRVEIQLSTNRSSPQQHNREFTGAIVDVEERWQETQAILNAKQEAEDLSRARTRFIANMSHEIRTPLNAIIGMTSVLQQSHLDSDQQLCIETLANGGKALLALVNDVLDLSKLDSTDIKLETAEFDLGSICEEAVDIVAASVEEKNLTLTMSCKKVVPQFLLGDAHRLRQLMLNLLSNAIKFTSHGGINIFVYWDHTIEDQGLLSVTIEDSGIGIPNDRIDGLFDAFTQADPSTTRKFGGTGLGLAICRQICQTMGGSIGANSVQGKGSSFTFKIPLRQIPKPKSNFNFKLQGVNLNTRHRLVTASLGHCLNIPCEFTSNRSEQAPNLRLHADGELLQLAMNTPMPVMTPQRLWNRIQKLQMGIASTISKPKVSTKTQLKILIAEDAIPNQLVVAAMLKQLDYRDVTIVDNGKLAVECCQTNTYDLILLDLHMPVMDGINAAKEIRNIVFTNTTPSIIAASADVTTDAKRATEDAGFDGWLAKPITRDALSKLLNDIETKQHQIP